MTGPASMRGPAGDPALELAREAGYLHLLIPGTYSTKKPRPQYALLQETTERMVATWTNRTYKDRHIAWMLRCGWFRGHILAVVDTDTPFAGATAHDMLPSTGWMVRTRGGSGNYHRYFLLADNVEDYEGTGHVNEITLRAGMTAPVMAPLNRGYQPEPGFGQGEPALLTADAWNTYIRYMKRVRRKPSAKLRPRKALRTEPASAPCPNRSQAWLSEDDHYCCPGDSASGWKNFLQSVCSRFVYRRWLSEGKQLPDLYRTAAYMHKVHENNRCHEHHYGRLDQLIKDTWAKACRRASDEGYSESQSRKGKLSVERRREATADRNSAIVASRAGGEQLRTIAETFGKSRSTVYRILRRAREGIPLPQAA